MYLVKKPPYPFIRDLRVCAVRLGADFILSSYLVLVIVFGIWFSVLRPA